MLDLYNNKYDKSILAQHIYSISLIDVLKTQILDISFIVKYILNPKYQLCDDEKTITNKMILQYQTHITENDLKYELFQYDSDDDSINFESYAENNP
jgi:hypothetical protein